MTRPKQGGSFFLQPSAVRALTGSREKNLAKSVGTRTATKHGEKPGMLRGRPSAVGSFFFCRYEGAASSCVFPSTSIPQDAGRGS